MRQHVALIGVDHILKNEKIIKEFGDKIKTKIIEFWEITDKIGI